jgi:hypothetical protein
MRFFEFLSESSGGIIRRAQEVAQGKPVTFAKGEDKISLVSTVTVPEDADSYETKEELVQGIQTALAANGNPTVMWSKEPKAGGAALITIWKDAKGKPIAFIKTAKAKSAGAFPIVWTNADFGKDTGYQQIDSKIAERAQFNLKPQEILPANVELNVSAIPQALNLEGNKNLPEDAKQQIRQLLQNVLEGKKDPVPGAAKYATTYEVDLGETVAPIALATGNFATGSYKEAEDSLLKPLGLTWKNLTTVIFPKGGGNLLYDSYLKINKDTTLKISSKDKKGGAAAAVTGLMKDIEDNPERFEGVTDNADFQEILGYVKIISDNRADTGPLILAVNFGMITEEEKNIILGNLGKGMKFNPNQTFPPGITAALKRKGAKYDDPAYDLGFHQLAGVAELVADRLNQLPNIGDFFKAVLERSTMVQVKSYMQKSGDAATFTAFQVIYPPVFDGTILVKAGNNYMSTRKPIGKISFKIP